MQAVVALHTLLWPAVVAALVVLCVVAGARALVGVEPWPWLDVVRIGVLAVLVAQAALGLVLALRGAAPAEGIHWIYGAAVIGVLLAPAVLRPEATGRSRGTVLAVSAGIAALLTWRLWGSG